MCFQCEVEYYHFQALTREQVSITAKFVLNEMVFSKKDHSAYVIKQIIYDEDYVGLKYSVVGEDKLFNEFELEKA